MTLSSTSVAQPDVHRARRPDEPLLQGRRRATGTTPRRRTCTVHVVGSEPPVANAGPDQTPGRGKVVTLDGSGIERPRQRPDHLRVDPGRRRRRPARSRRPAPRHAVEHDRAEADVHRAGHLRRAAGDLLPARRHRLTVLSTSDPDTVDINLLENQAPVANAGASADEQGHERDRHAERLGIERRRRRRDADLRVDAGGRQRRPGRLRDPTKVTLSNPTAVEPDVRRAALRDVDDPAVPARRDRLVQRRQRARRSPRCRSTPTARRPSGRRSVDALVAARRHGRHRDGARIRERRRRRPGRRLHLPVGADRQPGNAVRAELRRRQRDPDPGRRYAAERDVHRTRVQRRERARSTSA